MGADRFTIITEIRNRAIETLNKRYARLDQIATRWHFTVMFGWLPFTLVLLIVSERLIGPQDEVYGLAIAVMLSAVFAAAGGYYSGRRNGFHEAVTVVDSSLTELLHHSGEDHR